MICGNVTQWQRIIFDPLSWIDESRVMIPDYFSQDTCRAVINQVVIEQMALATEEIPHSDDMLACLFIDEWFFLRQAALLMACQRHRANLAINGRLQELPASARQFAGFPLLNSHFRQGDRLLSSSELAQCALQELLVFSPELPIALRQRIPLLFADFTATNCYTDPLFTADSGLLILAIQHAKRNS
ncbi:hypothetical protein [Serratia marcescens]|uniref:hypothetical protein n=1 Tax=Serratia marcescens TaxID=615 RepID=UPI00148CC9F5|nr:hypothetical protein [Serratia marcescens]QJU42306.1 hypothetical protein HMI62_24680 [Serratia marcescens]